LHCSFALARAAFFFAEERMTAKDFAGGPDKLSDAELAALNA
jgi:hypothetical protein